jgi:hypothetical protein
MPTLLFVLAFTGVPQVQLFPERGASNGRWDEVFRSLLALKQRACSAPASPPDADPVDRVVAVVLVEVVHERQHMGVAPVVFDRERLAQLTAGQEANGIALFARWAAEAPTSLDCGAALVAGVDALFDARFEPAHATIQVFASEEEMPESVGAVYAPCIRHQAAISSEPAASASSAASGDSPDHDLIAKIFGSPCGWAEDEERKRIPQLVSALARRLHTTEPTRMVSLGATRLRVSQAVLCDDMVVPLHSAQPVVHAFYNAPRAAPIAALDSLVAGPCKSRPIPRVAFRIQLGQQTTRSAALFAHHFLVETMWLERRRNTPRHHVTFMWEDADAAHAVAAADVPRPHRASSIASLAFESMRGDADLREERRLKGVGGAAASDSYLDALIRLLEAPVSPPAGGVRIAVEANCETAERLERFTARVVQWELRHLYSSRADLVGDITSS